MASTPELSWVLLRAFGPEGAAAPEGVDLGAAVAIAEKLGIAARIGARSPETAELAHASRMAAASQLKARELGREVAAAARDAGIPCCFLKGVALDAKGVLASGSRAIGDVDVLVPENAAPMLAAELERRGFRTGAGEEYPHQLRGLVHPMLGLVEIHRHLPGMARPGAKRFATFGDLDAAGALVAHPDVSEGVMLPTDAALLAHLLAHGLAQHGFQPGAYPSLRLIGDLIDLGMAGEGGDELLHGALRWIDRWVPIEETQAATSLCRRLAAGKAPLGDDQDGLLLRHFLAGRLDAKYTESLKLVQLAHPLAAEPSLAHHWATAKELLVLSRTQIDLIYGKPKSRWGYLGRRLLRPFDLVRRGARALYAATREKQA